MPKIVFKTPTRNGIEATGTGITVVIAKIRQLLRSRKVSATRTVLLAPRAGTVRVAHPKDAA